MNRQAGITFIELLVSLVALTVVAGGLGAAMVASVQFPDLSREETAASYVLQTCSDRIIANRRSKDPQKGFNSITSANATALCPNVTVNNYTFSSTVTVTSPGTGNGCPAAIATDCKRVLVTVLEATRNLSVSSVFWLIK
ncbi:MAG: prepilin-type N-terminal cleavage/methylation domain-containing protein [Magnetococcales bacterium]|nr:prepilin-type N-terminal cleavage/methylation domain-containing protein [Magnetococcales bacterium]MBF0438424.1 prepilin-type N-terminal cleavage/methylation domain-containing protein [Magnetococcales bacterium]